MVSIKKLMKEPGICSIPLAILWWVDLPITYIPWFVHYYWVISSVQL